MGNWLENVARRIGVHYIANKIALKRFPTVTGSNLIINGIIQRFGEGTVFIGNNVIINSGFQYNPIGGAGETILYAKNGGEIHIGSHVGISNSTFVALEKITIEDDVLIGGNCKIYDNDFHALDYVTRMIPGCKGVLVKPVTIKQGAFIGAHSIILKGVTIGRHSIVGAGSVVTKDIPDGEIWAGNPARFIRNIEKE